MFTDEYLAMKAYLSMKELGVICGSNQQLIGRALDDLGLWIIDDEPTEKAFAEGYIQYRDYPHRPDIGDRYLPTWHKEKTLAALETVGIVPLPEYAALCAVPSPVPPAANPRPAKPSYMDKHGD